MEVDPNGRWIRYNQRLGTGSFKVAFKGFDRKLGIEIAWLKVSTSHHMSEEDKARINREVAILKSLQNPYIIKCYGAWRDDRAEMNFITELFTSGTLRDFRHKHQGIEARHAVARWGKSILLGLQYLHTQNPPIIHRDLKCDNVFINGHSGEVKIADLGLAVVQNKAQTVIGTPEFMAPELYDEVYDERVDIYAFGMVMLELATLRFPYDELTNPAQIFKAVSSGRMPAALLDVRDEEVLTIIRSCITHNPQHRPRASDLLDHPFFKQELTAVDVEMKESKDADDYSMKVLGTLVEDSDGKMVHLQLKLPKDEVTGKKKVVEFDFDVENDTIPDVANEMSEALNLTQLEQQEVMAKIDFRLAEVLETSKPPSMRKSKSHATLVKVPHPSSDMAGLTVSRNKDKPENHYRINICTADRRNLLWEFVKALHELPLRVTNATISTKNGGKGVGEVVMDAFDVMMDEGSEWSASQLEAHLCDALEL